MIASILSENRGHVRWKPMLYGPALEGFFQLLNCETSLAQDGPESSFGHLLVVGYHEASVGR